MLDFLTRDVWDFLIFAVIVVGGAIALWRLRQDLSRPAADDAHEPQEVEGTSPPSSGAPSPPSSTSPES